MAIIALFCQPLANPAFAQVSTDLDQTFRGRVFLRDSPVDLSDRLQAVENETAARVTEAAVFPEPAADNLGSIIFTTRETILLEPVPEWDAIFSCLNFAMDSEGETYLGAVLPETNYIAWEARADVLGFPAWMLFDDIDDYPFWLSTDFILPDSGVFQSANGVYGTWRKLPAGMAYQVQTNSAGRFEWRLTFATRAELDAALDGLDAATNNLPQMLTPANAQSTAPLAPATQYREGDDEFSPNRIYEIYDGENYDFTIRFLNADGTLYSSAFGGDWQPFITFNTGGSPKWVASGGSSTAAVDAVAREGVATNAAAITDLQTNVPAHTQDISTITIPDTSPYPKRYGIVTAERTGTGAGNSGLVIRGDNLANSLINLPPNCENLPFSSGLLWMRFVDDPIITNDIPWIRNVNIVGGLTLGGETWLALPDMDAIEAEAASISAAMQRDTGTEGLVYAETNGGLWVVGYTGTATRVTVPAFSGSNAVQGISAAATGFGAVEALTMYAPKIELRYETPWLYPGSPDPVYLTRMVCALSGATNLQSVFWYHPDAEFSGVLYPDCLRRNMTRAEYGLVGFDPAADPILRRDEGSGTFTPCTKLADFVAPGLKATPYAVFMRVPFGGKTDFSGLEIAGEASYRGSRIGEVASDRLRIAYNLAYENAGVTNVVITSEVDLRPSSFRNNPIDRLSISNVTRIARRALEGSGTTNVTTLVVDNATEVWSLPNHVKTVRANRAEWLWIKNSWQTLEEVYADSLPYIPRLWTAPAPFISSGKVTGQTPSQKKYAALRHLSARSATWIDKYALSRCTNLESWNLDSVEFIDTMAFRDAISATRGGGGTFPGLRIGGERAFMNSQLRAADKETFPMLKETRPGFLSGCNRLSIIDILAEIVGHSLAGTAGTEGKYPPATNVVRIIASRARHLGGSAGANLPKLEQLQADNAIKIGGKVVWNTPFHYTHRFATETNGVKYTNDFVSFRSAIFLGAYGFANATNMPSFSAPNWTYAGGLINGQLANNPALTNVYTPNLLNTNGVAIGSTNIATFTWRGNYNPTGE